MIVKGLLGTKKENLDGLVAELNIPPGDINWGEYRQKEGTTPGELRRILPQLFMESGDNIILIGGHTSDPQLLGLRRLRKPSNGIDFIVNSEGLRNLSRTESIRQYSKKAETFYFDREGKLITFFYRTIGGVEIPLDFYESATEIEIGGCLILVAAPEYIISFKIRRNIGRIRTGLEAVSKDASDTVSLILAPYFRNELRHVDLMKIMQIVEQAVDLRDFVPSSETELPPYLAKFGNVYKQLTMKERSVFEKVLPQLYTTLTPRIGNHRY